MSVEAAPSWSGPISYATALAQIDEWLLPQGPTGVGAAIWAQGRIVAARSSGQARPEATVTEETLFAIASVTKPITAATVMTLVDRGLVSLDEPASRLVPEFRAQPDQQSSA